MIRQRRVIETNRNRSKSWPEQRGEAQEYVQRQPKSVTLFFALRNSIKKTKAALLAPSFLVVGSAQRRKTKTYAQNQR